MAALTLVLLAGVGPAGAAGAAVADTVAQVKGFKVEISGASGNKSVDSAWNAVVVQGRGRPVRVPLTCFVMTLSRTGVYVSGLGHTIRMYGSGKGSDGQRYFIAFWDDGKRKLMTVSNARGTGLCDTAAPSKVVTSAFGFALKAHV